MPGAAELSRPTHRGTLKASMGYTCFLTGSLPMVRTEMSLQVLVYNLRRVLNILGSTDLLEAVRA